MSTTVKIRISGALDLEILDEPLSPAGFVWSVTSAGITAKDLKMLILPNDHKVTASIQPVDARGNPAKIDGLANWTSSNVGIAKVENVSADSLSADIVPGSQLGSCQVNVTADADLGEGTESITGTLEVTVEAGGAVGFVISTSAPVEIPVAVPAK